MRWAFATIVLAGDRPATRDERRAAFAWAKAAGFEGVELSPRWCDLAAPSLAAEVADAGLVVSGVNLNRVIPTRTPHAAAHRDQMRRAADAATALGASVLNVSLSMPTRPTADRPPMRGDDADVAEHAAAADFAATLTGRGVRVVVELHDDGLCDTAERCLALARRAGARVNPDLGNICRGPGPLPDWRAELAALAPPAVCWHVKNYRAGQPAPLDDGDIDFAEAVATMRAAGFAGWVSIEGYVGDVLAHQRAGLAFLWRLVNP